MPLSCAMDGVSVASGTAGLITPALQISGTIRDYVVAAKTKSKDVEELQEEKSSEPIRTR